MSDLTLIVPLLNERKILPQLIEQIEILKPAQAIIVDGGSNDDSWQWLHEHWVDHARSQLLLTSEAGRARQMNTGAHCAEHDILLFLHADTQLPAQAKKLILAKASQANTKEFWGRFDVRFASSSRLMSLIAYCINLRSRVSGIATGDQAIFVSRELFNRVNGFDDIALMEDVALSKKLRRLSKLTSVRETVITSARRWEQNGVVRTVLKMWWYRLAFVLGISPTSLKRGYRDIR